MKREEIFKILESILLEDFLSGNELITEDSDLIEDFGFDSLDIVNLIVTLEHEFDVVLELENYHKVSKIVTLIEKLLNDY